MTFGIGGKHTAPRRQKRGLAVTQSLDGGRAVEQDVVQCCHCQRVWYWEPGSGRKRGWCTRCSGVTCGTPRCDACVPALQQLDNMEMGKDLLHRPIRVSAGGVILGS